MTATDSGSEPDWQQIRAFLDDSIGELNDADRDALMLRYFEKKPLAEVGAVLGVSEDAARMRVDRAVDKLRSRLAARGITSTAATLGTVLAQNLVGTTPSALAARITAFSLASTGATGLGSATGARPFTTGELAVATGLLLILGVGAWLKLSTSAPVQNPVAPAAEFVVPEPVARSGAPVVGAAATVGAPQRSGLELLFVDATTGWPVTNETAVLRGWEHGLTMMVDKSVRLEEGYCVAPFEVIARREFHVLSHVEGYADTRLRWNSDRGEAIPESYTVRLIRPVLIHGRVLDTEGRPVTGATVGFNTENRTTEWIPTEDHGVDYLTAETDAVGYWSLRRLAPGMVQYVYGGASHPEYSRSEVLYAARIPAFAEQLLDGTAVFRLREGGLVEGSVVDQAGRSVGFATVRVGHMGASRFRETQTEADGRFSVGGCEPGQGIVTADAEGYAPTARAIVIEPDTPRVELTLGAGRSLRLRVLNTHGEPVAGARISLDSFPRQERSVPIPQISFRADTDADGRCSWENAPEQPLEFSVFAPGYFINRAIRVRPDDEEHVIRLSPAFAISGAVRDSLTGDILPRFRLIMGWPEDLGELRRPRWSELERHSLVFGSGEFRHIIQEQMIGGVPNPGYVFRFEADGYASFITRGYKGDEGEVRLDVKLKPAEDIPVVVYSPHGGPAANAQIGLVSPGIEVRLVPGGITGDARHPLAWLRHADENGRCPIPDDDSIQRIIVAAQDGYAERTLEHLRQANAIQLNPWSRLEGVWRIDGQAVSGREVSLHFQHAVSFEQPVLDSQAYRATTDASGRFVFSQVPPGTLVVQPYLEIRLNHGADPADYIPILHKLTKLDRSSFHSKPGETTRVTLGDPSMTEPE